MLLKADQQRVTALLTETVTLLCKNGLHFKSQFKIEGLIGITLDQEDIFLVNINETVAVEGPVQENENANSPPPIDGRPTASKKRRQRHTPIESMQGVTSDSSLPCTKPASVTTPKESFVSAHLDNSSTSDRRSCSPVQPGSVKSQSEDVGLARPGSPRTSLPGKASETNVSDRIMSFCDVPIKLDYALGSQDSTGNTSDSRRVSEPTSKRPRRHMPSQASDASLVQEQNSVEPASFDMPSGSSACKMEPSDIIEIKEESLSDDEMKESIAGYSSYAEYSAAAAATYSNSDLDASQMYGETSGFQADTMFQGDMQPNVASRSHENPSFQTDRVMWQTMTRPSGGVMCTKCGTTLKSHRNLNLHDRHVHQGLYQHICHICGKGTKTKGDLRGHMASKHDVPKDFQCPICKHEFAYKHRLKRHILSAHGKRSQIARLEFSEPGAT